MGRAPCCDKARVKRGPWSPEEDATLRCYMERHGTGGNWIALPQKAGLNRCGKSCRLRWLNYLRPDIKRGGFTEEEDRMILALYHSLGSRWSVIASQLPGRTDNEVKNYWNTRLKKKLPPTDASFLRTTVAPSPPPPCNSLAAVQTETPGTGFASAPLYVSAASSSLSGEDDYGGSDIFGDLDLRDASDEYLNWCDLDEGIANPSGGADLWGDERKLEGMYQSNGSWEL